MRRITVPALIAVCILAGSTVWSAPTPEAETLWLAKRLRPIPDDEWQTIAGPRSAERYDIVKGDTLYDISKRLFGDAKYWPKIWALNNPSITNPHLIFPGNSVVFMPGSGSSLPSVSIAQGARGGQGGMTGEEPPRASRSSSGGTKVASNDDDEAYLDPARRSQEWRRLPLQGWELAPLPKNPEVDKNGFDRRSRITFPTSTGYEIENFAESEKMNELGTITGGRTDAKFFFMRDTVFVNANEDLQVGEVYSVTAEDPTAIRHSKSDRYGYSYPNLGRVRIIGVKDGLYVASIESARLPIPRKARVIALQPKVKSISPIPGPNPVEGVVIVDKSLGTHSFGQHKQVFIDRGSDDGVQPGMVFRVYEHYDPANGKKITSSDYVITADIMVAQVSPRICVGLVIRSLIPIAEGDSAVLLTDVTDVERPHGVREKAVEGETKDRAPLDQLDELDVSGGLGTDEAKELRQLEKFKEQGKDVEPPAAPKEPAAPTAPPAEEPNLDQKEAAPPPADEGVQPSTPSEINPNAPETAPAPAPESAAPTPPSDAPPPPPPPASEDAKALDEMLNQ